MYCRRYDLSNIQKIQVAFLYSMYHQGAGKTSVFHMRGVDFTHFNTCCIPLGKGCDLTFETFPTQVHENT